MGEGHGRGRCSLVWHGQHLRSMALVCRPVNHNKETILGPGLDTPRHEQPLGVEEGEGKGCCCFQLGCWYLSGGEQATRPLVQVFHRCGLICRRLAGRRSSRYLPTFRL